MRRDEDMRKMVSLLLFLVMIMYTSSISFADENNDNIESIVESHSSEKNDVDINSSETDNVSIMDKNNKSDICVQHDTFFVVT